MSPARLVAGTRELEAATTRRMFWLLTGFSFGATTLYGVLGLVLAPPGPFFWSALIGVLASASIALWAWRSARYLAALRTISVLMAVLVSTAVLQQHGAQAPGAVWGLGHVAVLVLAGLLRFGLGIAVWHAATVLAVTAAAAAGWLPPPVDPVVDARVLRLISMLGSLAMIGGAVAIAHRHRRALEHLVADALGHVEAERDLAERSAERKARFLAHMSHEIRTPMNGIVGTAELLARQSLTPAQRQLLSIQRRSAEQLLNLVNDVLDHAKLEAGKASLAAEPVSLRLLVADVADLYAAPAHRKGLEIGWTVDPAVPRGFVGDAVRLRQLLANLVANAVKFTDRGEVWLDLRPAAAGGVCIEVSDTGAGIPAALQPKIFEPYNADADNPAARRAGGTGLGLPICRELARLMGGTIRVDSTPGQGSRFRVELPLVPSAEALPEERPLPALPPGRVAVLGASAALTRQLGMLLGEIGATHRAVDALPPARGPGEPPEAVLIDAWGGRSDLPALLAEAQARGLRPLVVCDVAQDAALGLLDGAWQLFRPLRRGALHEALRWAYEGAVAAPDAPTGPAAALPRHALLVDDNPVNLMVGQAMLEQLGLAVTVAGGGREGVERALDGRCDVVLMDLHMPDLDGWAATRALREAERAAGRPPLPVVALSGSARADVSGSCEDAGMDAMLDKPYTLEQLRVALELIAARPAAA